MKFPIAWHKECLKNRRESLRRDIEQMDRLKKRIDIDLSEIDFYSTQISIAEQKKLDGFDSDRFNRPRNKQND